MMARPPLKEGNVRQVFPQLPSSPWHPPPTTIPLFSLGGRARGLARADDFCLIFVIDSKEMRLILFPTQSLQDSNYFSVSNFPYPIFAHDVPQFRVALFLLGYVFFIRILFHIDVYHHLFLGCQNMSIHPYFPPALQIHISCCLHLHLDASCPKWTSPSSSTNLFFPLYFLCIWQTDYQYTCLY